MHPNVYVDPYFYRRAYVQQGYPYIGTCGGRSFWNAECVDLLNRTVLPGNSTYVVIFHSHDITTPNNLNELYPLRDRLLNDISYYECFLQSPVPIVSHAVKNESTLDKIFLMRVEEKIRELISK